MSKAEELASSLIADAAKKPGWDQIAAVVAHLRALDASHQRLKALLDESQNSIGGDWRARRDAALEQAKDLS